MTFLVLALMRIITDKDMRVNFYIPISMVDENYNRAFKRNSTTEQKFFFRKHCCPLLEGYKESDEVVELSLHEIFDGSENFAGLRALIKAFIELNKKRLAAESSELKEDIVANLWRVFNFFADKCQGKVMTTPNYLRSFVYKHPEYKKDSVLSASIVYDVIKKVLEIQKANYQREIFEQHIY